MSSEALPSFLAALELSPAAQERDVRRSQAQRLTQIDQEAARNGSYSGAISKRSAARFIEAVAANSPTSTGLPTKAMRR